MSESASKSPPNASTDVHVSEPYNGDVVIGGISCRLPESDNMAEFRDNLMNGVDMVTEDNRRWEPGTFGIPRRHGKLKDLSKFDAEFFGVHPKQASFMDPMLRILLEVTYEAIVDAGLNPEELRGSRTGVFIGTQTGESSPIWSTSENWDMGYILTGTSMTMFSSRLSYFFDFKGPSLTMDTACSASMFALNQALASIRKGDCDAAIVGGANICLQPITSLHFMKLGMLNDAGMCRSFDEKGDGYCRSEGIVAMYLQKKESANRIYCTLVHSKTNSDGNKPEGVTFPSGDMQRRLLRETYKEAGVRPADVAYVEAHGTGTQAGDSQEGNAICDVFCKDREKPLLIGSVKSNMGHCESPSGVVAIAKMVIAMEEKVLPANLHYNSPNKAITGLLDGRMQVVSKNTAWEGGYVGINSFGFGGANVHATLKSHDKQKIQRSDGQRRRLFIYASRTQEGVDRVLSLAEKQPSDIYLHKLLNESAHMSLTSHPYRGFTVLNGSDSNRNVKKVSLVENRPVWFVLTGMGSQWAEMGRDMMEIEIFRKSIMESDAILKSFGVNLYDNLMSDGNQFDSVENSITGIISVQVALIDTLKSMGITPDGIVGHSVGEISCAYADGCFTAKEAVTAAYWRGHCIQTADIPKGAMAAVGLAWQETKDQCPPGVVPACHNAEDSVTVSGEEAAVRAFVDDLQENGVFAKMVDSAGVAFHSPFMQKVAPALRRALEQAITPKARTERWISSAFPESEWSTDTAKFSSAEYHVKNVVSPVLFHDALTHVPTNAVVIEIAPHGLLQSILKRSLGKECCIESLMKRGHPNNVEFFYSGLGKCYQAGLRLDPLKLFAPVELPVPSGTPMISPHISWDHSHTWNVPRPSNAKKDVMRGTTFEIDLSKDSEDRFLIDHKVEGRIVFPAAGYIVLVWRAIANREGKSIEEVPVHFEDFTIYRATMMSTENKNILEVHLIPGTNDFQVLEGQDMVAGGRVSIPEKKEMAKIFSLHEGSEEEENGIKGGITTADIYKNFKLLGFDFGPTFRSIIGANLKCSRAIVSWTGNWITFIDSVAQLDIAGCPKQRLPTRFTSLLIDPELHYQKIVELEDGSQGIKISTDRHIKSTTGGGVCAMGIQTNTARRHDKKQPILESHSFIPYSTSVKVASQGDLKAYADQCTRHSVKCLQGMINNGITNGFKTILDGDLLAGLSFEQLKDNSDKYSDGNKYSCLEVLKRISDTEPGETFAKKISASIQSNSETLQADPLIGNLLQTKYLKPCFDIVSENCQTKNLKIVEIANQNVTNALITLANLHPVLRISYSVATPDPGAFESDPYKNMFQEVLLWKHGDDKSKQLPRSHLVVANNTLRKQHNISETLSSISECLETGGFVLVNEITKNFHIVAPMDEMHNNTESGMYDDLCNRSCSIYSDASTWQKLFWEAGFEVVYDVTDNIMSSLFLLRKKSTNTLENQTILTLDGSSCSWVEELKTKLAEVQSRPKGENLWLKSDGNFSGILGMVNCLRFEPGGDRIRCIFNMDRTPSSLDDETMGRLVSRDFIVNVHRNGEWGSYRHLALQPVTAVPSEHAYIMTSHVGDLSSLKWYQSRLKYFSEATNCGKGICNIHYASLNFRDIMLATGKLSQDAIPGGLENQECMLGMEFSGIDMNGRRVMGMLPAKALATTVDANPDCLIPVPDKWSLEEAATVPVVYATALYALVIRGNIRRGNSVLIHSGTGGVGQAAISIALHYGCQVFTTVGSADKRQYLKEQFPQLNDSVIFNSRDTTFEIEILRATRGKGVDIVLNSLAGDKLKSSVRALANNGRFLEIGKVDLAMNTPLGMSVFLKNIAFHGILLDALFEPGNLELLDIYRQLTDGIKTGFVKPLKATVFDKSDVEGAFRYMASGKHMGKVLVKIRNDTKPACVPAIPKTFFHPEKVYIITGGLGGFGLELASWLADKGARNLVLTSRSGVKNGYQKHSLQCLRDREVDVIISKRNVGDKDDTVKMLQETNGKPVGGVFHLAMVLQDGLFENQTTETFQSVCDPKVQGTINLDQITRQKCKTTLDWFVVFSSITSGRGNAGQSNYGFANSAMERICEQRRKDGYHGLAIQWGPIADVGVFVETVGSDISLGGAVAQRIPSCMQALDLFLIQSEPVVSSFVPAEKSAAKKKASDGDIVQSIMNIIGITDPDSFDKNKTLGELGIDSLLGVEVKLTLENDYNLSLSPKDIRDATINSLQALVNEKTAKEENKDGGGSSSEEIELEIEYFLTPGVLEEYMPLRKILKLNDVTSGTPLFIIHHITGHCDILEHLASEIHVPVFGIQRTSDMIRNSLEEAAPLYIQALEDICPHGDFHLCGYSFGAVLAQEVALQFEARSRRPNSLILLDGSHESCNTLFKKVKMDDNHIEIKAMRKIMSLGGLVVENHELVFSEEMCKPAVAAAQRLKPDTPANEVIFACRTVHETTDLIATYTPSRKYTGNIHLIAADSSVYAYELDKYYGLKKSVRQSLFISLFLTTINRVANPRDFLMLFTDFSVQNSASQFCSGEVYVNVVSGRHVSFLLEESGIEVAKIIDEIIAST